MHWEIRMPPKSRVTDLVRGPLSRQPEMDDFEYEFNHRREDAIVLVGQDWLSLIPELSDGEWPPLPWPVVYFEYETLEHGDDGKSLPIHWVIRMNGRRFASFYSVPSRSPIWVAVPIDFANVKKGSIEHRAMYLVRVSMAVVTMIEAEVAETEIVKIPDKLNAARIKRRKPPLPDYMVVNLAKRHRYKKGDERLTAPRAGVRLHFRRGHWVHLEHGKVWRRWCLVGDPDLGWVEKMYKA
jgi:hypothetical protein